MCRRGRDRRFAETTENELPADGMPEQLKRRYDLEGRNSFSKGTGSELLGTAKGKSVGIGLRLFLKSIVDFVLLENWGRANSQPTTGPISEAGVSSCMVSIMLDTQVRLLAQKSHSEIG